MRIFLICLLLLIAGCDDGAVKVGYESDGESISVIVDPNTVKVEIDY